MQKVLNLVLIRQEVEGEKCSKTFFVVLERQNMQNQTVFKLYSHDNKSIYSINPKNIPKSEKKIYEKLYIKENLTAATTKVLRKIPNRKKIPNEHFNFCEAEISIDEIIKSINSEKNNKSPSNHGLAAELYQHFSNKLAAVLLDVYDSWESLASWMLLIKQKSA